MERFRSTAVVVSPRAIPGVDLFLPMNAGEVRREPRRAPLPVARLEVGGAGAGIRTPGLLITSELLYP